MQLTVLGPSWNHLGEPFAGGQEAFVSRLVAGLRERGHAIRLYAAAGTPADLADELITFPPPPPLSVTARLNPHLPEPQFLADHHAFTAAVTDLARRRDVDVILNQSLHHLPLAFSPLLPAAVLTTLHTPPLPWMEHGASVAAPDARYVAVSRATAQQWTTLPEIGVIPNGIDPTTFRPGPGGTDLVWVGRITPEKGLPLAIDAARRAGLPLSIVGPVSDPIHFQEQIEPVLGDGIRYLGHLGHRDVQTVVGASAACLVTPRWDEPFGLVAAEAMMCGTPVVALARGGLPEVVGRHGGVCVPGTGADVVGGLADAIPQAVRMDRNAVRADAVARLSSEAMLDAYENLITAMVRSPRRGRLLPR